MPNFTPVNVLVGLGFPCEIRNVHRALAALDDWHRRKGMEYHAARTACTEAISGLGSVEAAREAFVTFARSADILIEDARMPVGMGEIRGTSARG